MKHIIRELESIINDTLRDMPLPYVKGNSIRVGKVIIRYSKTNGYVIFDCEKQKKIANTYSKAAALAIAKRYNKGYDIKKILDLDQSYQKHDLDCFFFEHTMNTSKDNNKKEVATDRYDCSYQQAIKYKSQIENFIFN